MSKIKKILAVLVTLAMVMAMSVTAFAAPDNNGSIIVKGLTVNDGTRVDIYKVVSLSDADSAWVVENWAASKVTTTSDPYAINWNDLKTLVDNSKDTENPILPSASQTAATGSTSVTFTGLDRGVYLILAYGNNTEYNVMGAITYAYDESTNLMTSTTQIINAKGSDYTVTKLFTNTGDSFVARGDEVEFDINTTFPSYGNDENGNPVTNREFTITDEPTGMKITEITVSVGATTVEAGTAYTLIDSANSAITLPAAENQAVTVSFTKNYIGTEDTHAGAAVNVHVKAIITSDSVYSNKASTNKASDPTVPVPGDTGSIKINKVDKDKNALTGAKPCVLG